MGPPMGTGGPWLQSHWGKWGGLCGPTSPTTIFDSAHGFKHVKKEEAQNTKEPQHIHVAEVGTAFLDLFIFLYIYIYICIHSCINLFVCVNIHLLFSVLFLKAASINNSVSLFYFVLPPTASA